MFNGNYSGCSEVQWRTGWGFFCRGLLSPDEIARKNLCKSLHNDSFKTDVLFRNVDEMEELLSRKRDAKTRSDEEIEIAMEHAGEP